MTQNKIKQILDRQRAFFHTGATLDVSYRLDSLRRLRNCITRHEADINKALKKDLGKSAFETYMCETGLVLSEISYMLKHTRSLQRKTRPYATRPVSFEKLSKTFALWCMSDHESLELPIPLDD